MSWESDQFDAIRCELADIKRMLGAVLRGEYTIIQKEETIMTIADDIAASVATEDTTIDSAVALIQQISAALAAAGTDPAKLTALKADIDAKTAVLAAAVVAGTPTPVTTSPPVTPAAAASIAKAAVAVS